MGELDKNSILNEYLNLCKLVDENFSGINEEIKGAKLSKELKRLLWLRHVEFYLAAARMLGAKGNVYDYARRHGFSARTVCEFRRFEKIWDEISKQWWGIIESIRGYACGLPKLQK